MEKPVTPKHEDYGLTQDQVKTASLVPFWGVMTFLLTSVATGIMNINYAIYSGFVSWLIYWLFVALLQPYYWRFRRYQFSLHNYRHAVAVYAEWLRRTRTDFWLNLDGIAFEKELADLYRRLGYSVSTTPVTGDGGIDLVLNKDGITSIVQCKRHNRPVGVSIVRELFGVMVSEQADQAILACTGGFTQKTQDFVHGKPITLLGLPGIITMQESLDVYPSTTTQVPKS